MSAPSAPLHACSLQELREKGTLVVNGPVPIALFYDDGEVHAVDNRCPHIGFPLHRGSIENGIVTCHWHHARFDASSGGTFDLFADDVTAYPVELCDGEVYIRTEGAAPDPLVRGRQRLQEGMQQNIRLVVAKAVVTLLNAGLDPDDLVDLLQQTFAELPGLVETGGDRTWEAPDDLTDTFLGDDPAAAVEALKEALRAGAQPLQLARQIAYAAAVRIARFHVQNEFADWIAVLHTFTYANALHQLLKRAQSPDLLRGVFHGAIRIYLDRFLDIPPPACPPPPPRRAGLRSRVIDSIPRIRARAGPGWDRPFPFVPFGGNPAAGEPASLHRHTPICPFSSFFIPFFLTLFSFPPRLPRCRRIPRRREDVPR